MACFKYLSTLAVGTFPLPYVVRENLYVVVILFLVNSFKYIGDQEGHYEVDMATLLKEGIALTDWRGGYLW